MASVTPNSSQNPQHRRSNEDESIPLRYIPEPSNNALENPSMSRGSNSSETTPIGKNAFSGGNLDAMGAQRGEEVTDVRRQKRSLLLLGLYLLLLVIPFPLTAVMVYRPLKLPSYVDFQSRHSPADFDFNYRAQVIVRVMNSIRAVATVPLVGVVLAQVAVIHTQRRGSNSQKLSLGEIFRLADRGWTDPMALWHAIRRRQRFLPLGALVLLLFAITQPFEQLLVQTTTLNVMTCNDHPLCAILHPFQVGTDPSLNAIAQVPLCRTIPLITNAITTSTVDELNPYLWTKGNEAYDDIEYTKPATLAESTELFENNKPFQSQPFWTSILQNGTTTGILREHAVRLNSSIKCESIALEDFPWPCPGDRPVVSQWGDDNDLSEFEVTACAPGNYTKSPWNHSRDRQDIREELYIDAFNNQKNMGWGPVLSERITLRCVAKTTRGYFELGNQFNGQVPQPLINTWPSAEEMEEKFVDYEADARESLKPKFMSAHDNDTGYVDIPLPDRIPPEYQIRTEDNRLVPAQTPGPLVQTAIATFGNRSLLGVLANNPTPRAAHIVCKYLNVPFANFDFTFKYWPHCDPDDYETPRQAMGDSLLQWMDNWREIEDVHKFLSLSMFFANYATLSVASSGIDQESITPARKIYTSDGYSTQKPTAKLASIIFLGTLYLMQFIVLIRLAVYIWQNPTWTHGLDSFAIGQMVANMDKDSREELAQTEKGPGRSRRLSDLGGFVGGGSFGGDG